MSETPTTTDASRFTELTTEQLEANRRSVYAYAVLPAPELLSAERLAEICGLHEAWLPYRAKCLSDAIGAAERFVETLRGQRGDLLTHTAAQAKQIRLLTILADSPHWTAIEMRDGLVAAEARAAEAEAQVVMLRVELAEQEAQGKQRGGQLFTALSCLAAMWNQYCPPPTGAFPYPGHSFMSAGEETEEVLDFWGMLRAEETAIDPECHWARSCDQRNAQWR